MELFRGAFSFQKKNLILIATLLGVTLLLFFMARVFFFVVFFVLLNFLGGFMASKARLFIRNIGIEFVTVSTIICGLAFGPVVGAMVGLLSRLAEALSMRRDFSLIVTLPLYGLLGFVAGVLHPIDAIGSSLILMAIFCIVTAVLSVMILRARMNIILLFLVTQILFNTFLMTKMMPFILAIIAL